MVNCTENANSSSLLFARSVLSTVIYVCKRIQNLHFFFLSYDSYFSEKVVSNTEAFN